MTSMKIKNGYILRTIGAVHIIIPAGERVIEFKGMMSLNDTGAFLWNSMGSQVTEEELVQMLLAEYPVDTDTAKEDVAQFVQSVRKAGALEE